MQSFKSASSEDRARDQLPPVATMLPRFGRKRGPLLGSFEENVLNNRLKPIRSVDGYKVEIRASAGRCQPRPLKTNVRVNFFSAGGNSFPYLGQINIGNRGYRIPKKGTLQVTLFNPLGTVVNLFLLHYDWSDMPENSQTFVRQKTILAPSDSSHSETTEVVSCQPQDKQQDCDRMHINSSNSNNKSVPAVVNRTKPPRLAIPQRQVRYLIQLNIVSSKSGRIYLNKDLRIFISKKVDLDTAVEHADQACQLKFIDEMPTNPRYFAR